MARTVCCATIVTRARAALSFEIKASGQPYCCVRRTFVHGIVPSGGCLDLDPAPAPPHFYFYSWMYEFSSVLRLSK
jgi:hypothetical protein